VELLGIRPLLFGIAWKVLDLALDEALRQASVRQDSRRGYTIELKRKCFSNAPGPPPFLGPNVWSALCEIYKNSVELRHSLVHRRIRTDPQGWLRASGVSSPSVGAISPGEQEALAQVAAYVRAASRSATIDARADAALTPWLRVLARFHTVRLASTALPAPLPHVTIDAAPSPETGLYPIDFSAIEADPNLKSSPYADLTIQISDQAETALSGHLEDAPNSAYDLDPNSPPSWLT
jgi:hypothetical protein